MNRRGRMLLCLTLLGGMPVASGCAREDNNRAAAEQFVQRRNQAAHGAGQADGSTASDGGTAGSTPANAHAVHSDGLIVNNEIVTVDDILEPIQPQIDELAATLTGELYYNRVLELVRQQIVDNVAQLLIYRRASEQIKEDMEPAVKKAVEQMERERITREFHGLETEYENYLQRRRKTRADVQHRLRRLIVVDMYLRERLKVPAPRKKELLRYYEEHRSEFSSEPYRELYLIDIPSAAFYDPEILRRRRPPLPEEDRLAMARARQDIEAAMTAIRSGQAFEDVARQYSQGPNKEQGGFWGPIRSPMAGRWKAPYERFLQMKEGEVSDIIESANAFFIVKVGRVREETVQSFEEAQPSIISALRNQRFHKMKSEFLQAELDRSTIGPLDQFVREVMTAVPKPGERRSS